VLVTHNPELAGRYASRTIELVDGRIADPSKPNVQEVVG
jgi:predicted ABC-type transport system involved in lysophospholipase L1 biosynthesis ATPase subunit